MDLVEGLYHTNLSRWPARVQGSTPGSGWFHALQEVHNVQDLHVTVWLGVGQVSRGSCLQSCGPFESSHPLSLRVCRSIGVCMTSHHVGRWSCKKSL